ncbi:hypothetical protein KH5_22630 [Urechidicola sp. KH5]
MKNFAILILMLTLVSCQTKQKDNTQIFWVNSSKKACSGVGKMSCLQIQKSDELDFSKEWELFYTPIKSFNYIPGKLYKIKVKVTEIKNPPADSSSLRYELIEILEEKVDKRLAINDIWVAEKIYELPLQNGYEERPRLEINSATMKVNGTDGCNNINGGITEMSDDHIIFGPLLQTKKMCVDMTIPDAFTKALTEVNGYKKVKNRLHLFNKNNDLVLTFQKID